MTFFFETLLGGLLAGTLYSLVAIGFVLIYKASGVFNFAQGSMLLFAALTFVSLHDQGVPFALALLLTVIVMIIGALLIERLVLRPLVNRSQITLFMATLGLSFIIEGLAQGLMGIALQTPLSFGVATNVIGALVLLLWWPIRQKPGLGTVLNVMLIGPSAQFGLWLLPEVHGLAWQVPVFVCGLLMVAVATGLYIGARFGPGPRDGLMTGLHARTGWPIWVVRSLIEGSVLLIGWWLGGNVGVGTLAFALLIGPLCGVTLPLFGIRKPAPAAVAAP